MENSSLSIHNKIQSKDPPQNQGILTKRSVHLEKGFYGVSHYIIHEPLNLTSTVQKKRHQKFKGYGFMIIRKLQTMAPSLMPSTPGD